MKSSKIISVIIVLIMLMSLASCELLHSHMGHGGNQSQTGEGSEGEGESESKVMYVYSVLSKVIHIPGCYHIDRIKEDYLKETDNIAPLFEKGYTVCTDCFKIKQDEPEEEEDEKDKVAKEDATYVINASSKKLHCLDCYHVEGMVEKNLEYTDLTLEELLALDYIPCGTCMPDEAEDYEKSNSKSK